MDEDALVKALDKGTILSCGLDVYEEEPKIHPGLIANPRVMLLPHMGTWTEEVSLAITTLSPVVRPSRSCTDGARLKRRWRSGISTTSDRRSRRESWRVRCRSRRIWHDDLGPSTGTGPLSICLVRGGYLLMYLFPDSVYLTLVVR